MLSIGIECENLEDSKSRWGVGQVTLNLLQEYADNPEWQKKYKLYLYFKKSVPEDDVFKSASWRTKFNIRVAGVPSFNIFYHVALPIRAMMDRLDYMFFPAYQLPPLYFGKSIVILTPDVFYEYKEGTLPFRYRLSYRLFTNWAAKFATKIMAISETSKNEVSELYNIDSGKIFVARPGVDTSGDVSAVRTGFPYVMFVAQMFPRRHSRETILAFKKIATEFQELRLIMVGKDKYPVPLISDLIKNINKELGSERIIYHEYIEKREELYGLVSGARALVYVSDREAFGLPPMEALSFGVPPVLMENRLGHELFEDYAFFAKSGEPEDIADGIRKALTDTDKINKIRVSGPDFTRKYNWKNFAEKFFNNLK